VSTIETYQKYGVSLLKAHEDGAVTFTINKEGIQVSKFLKWVQLIKKNKQTPFL